MFIDLLKEKNNQSRRIEMKKAKQSKKNTSNNINYVFDVVLNNEFKDISPLDSMIKILKGNKKTIKED
jgi:hypothetical protein